jgi:hypothetical protein
MKHRVLFSCVCLLILPCAVLGADDLPSYTIHRTRCPITIDGRLHEAAWAAVPSVGPFRFSWHKEGEREQTTARLLWDDDFLYVSYVCDDAHISAEFTQRDEPVYRDDCVELFTAPNPDRPQEYFNFEMNVRAALLDQHHPEGRFSGLKNEWNSDGVRIAVQIAGTLNDDSDRDCYWVLEAAIPWSNFAGVAKQLPPQPGDVWRLNLNRCGGKTNEQYSQWSSSATPKPDYHVPERFGQVTFVGDVAEVYSRTRPMFSRVLRRRH